MAIQSIGAAGLPTIGLLALQYLPPDPILILIQYTNTGAPAVRLWAASSPCYSIPSFVRLGQGVVAYSTTTPWLDKN